MLEDGNVMYRPMEWMYSLARVLRFGELLPVDVDTIILLLNKMRINS